VRWLGERGVDRPPDTVAVGDLTVAEAEDAIAQRSEMAGSFLIMCLGGFAIV